MKRQFLKMAVANVECEIVSENSSSVTLKCAGLCVFISVGLLHVHDFEDFIYLFLERGEGREKERERHTNVWLPLARPLLGTRPTTQACALTWRVAH